MPFTQGGTGVGGGGSVTYSNNVLYNNGSLIKIVAPYVYQLGGQPYPWDVPVGTEIMIDATSSLSGIGETLIPLKFVSDGVVWQPVVEQALYSAHGTYAAPVATIGASNNSELAFMAGNLPVIPWDFYYLGLGIRFQAVMFKNDANTTGATFRIRFGTNVSNGSNIVALQFTSAAANSQISFDRTIRIGSLGIAGQASFTSAGAAKLYTSATTASDGAGDFSTLFSTAQSNWVTFSAQINAAATAALLSYKISLVP